MKLLNSVLAVTSLVMAVPVARNSNHTGASLSTTVDRALVASGGSHSSSILGDDDDDDNNKFQIFGTSYTGTFPNITVLNREVVDELDMTPQEDHTADRLHVAVGSTEEGRPGKLPYKRFPPCYAKCFDSEGIESKTSGLIGDIRDLTTEEFCRTKIWWTGLWFLRHLQWCTKGECKSCSKTCHHDAGKTYYELCGRSFRSNWQ